MGLVCIQNSSLLVYSKSQKVSASYCLPFRHSRGKNQPVGGFRPPPGLFRVKSYNTGLTAFITFKMTNIASGNQEFVNGVIGNINANHRTFYRTYSGLCLLISIAHDGTYIALANDSSSLIPKPHLKFPSSKSNFTDFNKWHVISVTWSESDKENKLNYCWCNSKKLITFTTGNVKGSYHCYI